MHVRHGRLQCDESTAQARWQCIVAAACMRQGTGMAGTLMAKSGTRSLVVTVLPIHAHHPAAFLETPLALVVLHDPDAPQGMDPRLIADMLGLSPTETRLALMIASGRTIKDFAAAEGMSWHTARTHIKNLLRKTGCRRQMEIAALLRSLRMGDASSGTGAWPTCGSSVASERDTEFPAARGAYREPEALKPERCLGQRF